MMLPDMEAIQSSFKNGLLHCIHFIITCGDYAGCLTDRVDKTFQNFLEPMLFEKTVLYSCRYGYT